MIKLRPYQEEPVAKAIRFFQQPQAEPSLIVLPTGWGKSILTAFVAKSIPENDHLLVVQPSKELLEQNYGKYIALCEQEAHAGIFSASFGKKQIDKITYATIGSIKDLGSLFRQHGFTKMLIDEAHLYPRGEQSMLGKFLKDSGIRQVLGITATPLKLESFTEKQGEKFDKWSTLVMLTAPSVTGDFFKNILHIGQIQEIISMKFWSPLVYENIPFDTSMLRLNTTGAEYAADSIEEAYKLNNIRANIYGALNYHSERRHCIVFVPSVEEAAILASEYPSAAYLSGEMKKKDRAAIINGFKTGLIRVIFNVGILQTGFDYPKIDMIIFAMSTASVARYYQMVGRGVRIDPEKQNCLVVDMGGNLDRFGRVEDMYFEFTDRWRMYGSGQRLLTGIPYDCLGYVFKDDIATAYANAYRYSDILTFGKHKGKHIFEAPLSYKKWLLKTEVTERNFGYKCQCLCNIENYTRDTRNDPPEIKMRDGQHAGEFIVDVPKGYLVWYYKNHEWGPYNDALRRGIELAIHNPYAAQAATERLL